MAKVICAVLRYTEEQKSLILEHERLRQSVSDRAREMTVLSIVHLAMDQWLEMIVLWQ